LIITQILAVLSLPPWLIFAALSPLCFDSGYTLSAVLIVGAIWLYPLLPLSSAILAWWLYRHGKRRGAVISSSVLLVVAVPLLLYGARALLSYL
jgi:hypothetical protein